MKRRLHDSALPKVELAARSHDPVAEERACSIKNQALVQTVGLSHQGTMHDSR